MLSILSVGWAIVWTRLMPDQGTATPAVVEPSAHEGGSLRLRLVLGAALWVFVALAVAVVVLRGLFVSYVEDQVRERLITDLNQLVAYLEVDGNGKASLTQPLSDPQFHRPLSGLYWQIETLDGRGVLRSRSLWDNVLQVPHQAQKASNADDIQTHIIAGPQSSRLLITERQVVFPDYDQPLRIMVGWDESKLQGLIDAFTRTLSLSFAVLAVGIVAAAWAQVAFGLGPLRRLRGALASVGSGQSSRLQGVYPREVMPLVEDLNAMLGRNERMMTSASDAAGNLAHALKTPLAIIANEAQALAERGDCEGSALLSQQVELMRRQVDHHLARARAQAAGEARGMSTAVSPSLARLARVMRRLNDCQIDVFEASPPAFRGDAQTLEEILGNLMENACKWAETRVNVRAGRGVFATGEPCLELAIEDDGPGIPADRFDEVLRRGRRLDESKPGSGLGLSIVDDLTRATGGSLTLGASPTLGGLQVVVQLPRPKGGAAAQSEPSVSPPTAGSIAQQ